MILEHIIKEEDLNKTINQILNEQFKLSNRLFTKLLNNKKILLNNTSIDTRLAANINDVLKIDFTYDEYNSNIVPTKMNLKILYEDNGLLILDKPAGIPIHPSMMHYKNSLSNGVKYYFDNIGLNKKIRPVNRLDLGTSGLVIFAKNEFIQENLIKQMSSNTFCKEYIALVKGTFENKKGIVNEPIARKENSIIERCISNDGQNSITEYEVIKEYSKFTLIKCKLLTGRTHQIRVHMSHIGHPLVGDSLYGEASDIINRQALHSSKISFIHPISKKYFEIQSCLPNDILNLIN